jgi:hypothetical protein
VELVSAIMPVRTSKAYTEVTDLNRTFAPTEVDCIHRGLMIEFPLTVNITNDPSLNHLQRPLPKTDPLQSKQTTRQLLLKILK